MTSRNVQIFARLLKLTVLKNASSSSVSSSTTVDISAIPKTSCHDVLATKSINPEAEDTDSSSYSNVSRKNGKYRTKLRNIPKNVSLEDLAGKTLLESELEPDVDIDLENSTNFGYSEMSQRFQKKDVIKTDAAKRSYTLSPLMEKSSVLRKLADMGVELWKIEDIPDAGNALLKLDWNQDIMPRLRLLVTYAKFDSNGLAKYLTENPWIFVQSLDDIQTRLNYLESKGFSPDNVARIIANAKYWLNIKTETIDSRIAWLKNEFQLTANETRAVIIKNPKIITLGTGHVEFILFSVKEEMGFNDDEAKALLLKEPVIFTSYKNVIVKSFDYLHNTLKFSHSELLKFPRVLRCYDSEIRARHEFLKGRQMDQYDPEKPNYVNLGQLCRLSDRNFCKDIAKCSVAEYNRFLKRR